MSTIDPRLYDLLEIEEGKRSTAYRDTAGNWTIGVGHNLTACGYTDDLARAQVWSDAEIDGQLRDDVQGTVDAVVMRWPWMVRLDDVRFAVMVDMAFNMGVGTLSGFTNTLQAVMQERWADAADGMIRSKWGQGVTHGRAVRLADMMLSGEWPEGLA